MEATDKRSLFWSITSFFTILLFLTLIIEVTDTDRMFADFLYKYEGNQWHFKNEWITATLVHKGGKYFSIAMLLVVVIVLVLSCVTSVLAPWKSRLQYLLIATITGSLLVSVGKSITNISCPWDFSRYGGVQEYISLIEQLWVRNGSQCFPAGHASAGFVWVALYFVGRYNNAWWRWWVLGFALTMGCTFGFSQQLRGAHFLSHDLWSFGICWMVSLTCYEVMLKPYETIK